MSLPVECCGGPLDGRRVLLDLEPERCSAAAGYLLPLDGIMSAFPWPNGWYYLSGDPVRFQWRPESFIAADVDWLRENPITFVPER